MGKRDIHDALGDIVGMGLSPKKPEPEATPAPAPEPKPEETQAIAPKKRKLAKRENANYTKTFLHLPNEIHERLGVAAARIRGKDKSDITAEALAEWLDKQGM